MSEELPKYTCQIQARPCPQPCGNAQCAAPEAVPVPPMPAAWCAARRAEIQGAVDLLRPTPDWPQARTMLLELLAQLKQAERESADERHETIHAERQLHQARQQLAARAWVAVADRLPEPNTDVLVWPKTRKEGVAPYTKVYVAEYHRAFSADQQPAYWQGEQEWWDVWEITHWQPLPPTPRG